MCVNDGLLSPGIPLNIRIDTAIVTLIPWLFKVNFILNDNIHRIGFGGILVFLLTDLSIILLGRLDPPPLPGGQLGPFCPPLAGQPGVLDARGDDRVLLIARPEDRLRQWTRRVRYWTGVGWRGVGVDEDLGDNSIEKKWLEFWLEKPLEFWPEIPYTNKKFKKLLV